MSMPVQDEKTTGEFTRLHIMPLTPDLIKTYLGPSLAPLARNVSYHTVQTFPDKGFGYLELPAMEAAKLKKKLNGSILKGHKISIDEARPEKRKHMADTAEDNEDQNRDIEKTHKKTRRSKKIKLQDGVVPGHELEEGRKIKRGWTETPEEKKQERISKRTKHDKSRDEKGKDVKKAKKSRQASKYTTTPECLFRTSLPPNAEPAKDADKKSKKAGKKSRSDRAVVVHEFEKTKKHASFLRSARPDIDSVVTQEYVDDKGWVAADGSVLEPETDKQRERREKKERKERKKAKKAMLDVNGSTGEEKGKASAAEPLENLGTEELAKSDTRGHSPADVLAVADGSSTIVHDEQGSIPPAETPVAVHPLEALYKRPKLGPLEMPAPAPKDPGFSFFGDGDDSDIEDEARDQVADTMPQTPYTKQDMEWRNVRSAAPTPDTAAIGRKFSFPFMKHINEKEEENSESDDEDGATEGQGDAVVEEAANGLGIEDGTLAAKERHENGTKEESEFAKWFYEHRSENNKKWRARRREAMKMKRKRENRRLTRRIV